MMKPKYMYLLAFGLIAVGSSCDRKLEDLTLLGKEYIPTQIGKYIIYDVDSMFWDNFTKTYTVKKMEMKYEFTDTFTSSSGDLSYVISVSVKDSGATEFKPNIVDHITVTDEKVIYYCKNLNFINLTFPITTSAYWNGLSMIDRDKNVYPEFYSNEWVYEYSNIAKPFKSGSKTFENTITVDHIDYTLNDPEVDKPSFAEKILSKEVYAKGLGMVYKEFIYWEYQSTFAYRDGKGVKMQYKSSN